MPEKKYDEDDSTCQVTFTLPGEVAAEAAALCGDFNDWDPTSHPMKRDEDGSFKLVVELPAGHSFRYRFLLDEERWENDWEAERYASNPFGEEDSVISV